MDVFISEKMYITRVMSQDTQALKIQKQEIEWHKAILFIKSKLNIPFNEAEGNEIEIDPYFLIQYFESVKDALRRMERGVHTLERYCYIICKYIDRIIIPDNDNDKNEKEILIQKCKQEYKLIGSLAKREYRANAPNKKTKSRSQHTIVFQKLDDFQAQIMHEYRRSQHYNWDENTLKAYEDEFNGIRTKLISIQKPLLAFQMNHVHKVSQYLVNQINEIIEYKKKPNSKCAKIKRNHTEPEPKTVKQYLDTFYTFVRRHKGNIQGLEDIIVDPESMIIQSLDKSKYNWGHIDKFLTSIKYVIGCAFSVSILKAKGVTFRYCHSILSAIEDWAGVKRKKWNFQKANERKARDPYTYLVQRFGKFITWDLLAREIKRITGTPSPEPISSLRMLLSLYTDFIPRRSLDYAKMIIIRNDDDLINCGDNCVNITEDHNILIFTPRRKRFIFNFWKCSNEKGTQSFNIKDQPLINSITRHINDPQYNECPKILLKNGKMYSFLLYDYRTNEPVLDDQSVCIQMAELRKRWDIPFSIRSLRHSFATWCIRKKLPYNQVEQIAENMGSSMKMLRTVYYDADVLDEFSIDDIPMSEQNYINDEQFEEMKDVEKRRDENILEEIFEDNHFDDLEPYKDGKAIEEGKKDETIITYIPPAKPNPLSAEYPRPTRFFGGRSHPCIGDCRKGSALINSVDDDDSDIPEEEEEDENGVPVDHDDEIMRRMEVHHVVTCPLDQGNRGQGRGCGRGRGRGHGRGNK